MDNIFTQIMKGMVAVNQNIVDLSEEVAQMRADIVALKELLQPLTQPMEGMEMD